MDLRQLNNEGREIWDAKAAFWDALHGDSGNVFHRRLVEPSVLQLLELRAGERVLDVGCGNGVLARTMERQGVNVLAVDFSARMIDLARRRGGNIDYRVVDATDENALLALGISSFDAVTCSMALMDMPVIAPLFRASSRLLRRGGRFVFETMHPAFNSNNPVFLHEKSDKDGVVSDAYAVKIYDYLDMPPVKGAGAPGEPTPHSYYHRSLQDLLGDAFAAGFVVDALLEPAFTMEDAANVEKLTWQQFAQIPPILTARMRVMTG